jgi:hypothetical protein
LLRVGDIVPFTNAAAGSYRSTFIGGKLMVQTGSALTITKATSGTFTYHAHLYCLTNGNATYAFVADSNQWAASAKRFYYVGLEGATPNFVEVQLVGPSTFSLFTNTAANIVYSDSTRYIYDTGSGTISSNMVSIGGHITFEGTGTHATGIVTAHAGIFLSPATASSVFMVDFLRRTPVNSFPNAP